MKRIDSHVHLYKDSHNKALAWMSPDHLLKGNHEIDNYLSETGESPPAGVIYIETDRKTGQEHENDKWDNVIEEFEYVSKIQNPIVKGMVFWAPLNEGAESMENYMLKLEQVNSSSIHLIKGFRYLLQDKPSGTGLTENFIQSLNWMGSKELVFEIGIDIRSGGIWQAEEALEMVNRCPNLTYIIDHITKPDMVTDNVTEGPIFQQWIKIMSSLSKANTYVKISGIFNELPEHLVREKNISEILDRLAPWLEIVLRYWKHDRILWGSDWPVCKLGGGETALQFWNEISNAIIRKFGFSKEDAQAWYFENCLKAYNIKSL